ncbi:phosphomutase-like protein [Pseudozyma hubeiensis SY62]|uniref:Phosphomutase-like protein n=1 Tax=Pseudozyma hubeiensis (strain SY62) TaxID=1305764 RepID=R9NVW8_PSEHS|nr:phosphomutase-like protein [Pseudozyma hubeiensis SY62]GAC92668.1 phosphomutase-like protein [Pseudozyma hubeiensis SY62]
MSTSYTFSTYTGFFQYDTVEGTTLPAVAPNFGLRSNTTWADLSQRLLELNAQGLATDGSSYKLLFAGRHGQGFHNVAQSKYGNTAWDSYWSELTTDGTLVWGPDARLTPLGIQQAQAVHDAWVAMLQQQDHAPLPTKLFSSPLSRALSTMEISYDKLLLNNPNDTASASQVQPRNAGLEAQLQGLLAQLGQGKVPAGLESQLKSILSQVGKLPADVSAQVENVLSQVKSGQIPAGLGPLLQGIYSQFVGKPTPLVKELFREEYGEHTCDERRTKSQLAKDYPNVRFEPGFAEKDELWTTTREEDSHLDGRIQQALTQMWHEAPLDEVVSLTSHSGVMQSIFRVVGHYPISPATGAFIPLVIKATPN